MGIALIACAQLMRTNIPIGCHSQASTSSPRHLDPTTVAAPTARRTRALRTVMTA
jgi:hypothetical protein